LKVYCNDDECLWFKELAKRHIIKYSRFHEPAFEDSGFKGVCVRDDVGVEPKIVELPNGASRKLMICMTRSDKGISGHRDFSKMMPQHVDEAGMKEWDKHKNNLHATVGIDLKKKENDNKR